MSTNGLTLHTLDDVERLARIAITSGLTSLRRPEEAAVILMTGHELGLSPMQALRGIYVVSGRPVLSADLMVAVVRRSGLCESWRVVESTPLRCEIWTLRKGEDTVAKRVWTMDDAKRAGVTGKGTWAQYPAAMLRHRCAADLAREVFPDVLLGLYDPEELGDEPTQTEPAVVEVEAPASTWPSDLRACETLRDVRAAYASHAKPDADTGGLRDDVRAWCEEHGVAVTAAEVTAILSTLPEGALAALDALHEDEERDAEGRCVDAARRVARERSAWDAHSATVAAKIVARSYAHAAGVDLRTAGATLKRIVANDEPEPPATGTDGPRSREPGEDDGEDPAGYDAHRAAKDAQPSAEHAWRETAAGITAHVAGLSSARHLESSARRHLREIREDLTTHAVHAYAGRVQRLSHDGTSALPWDECVARIEKWLREGPRVTTLAPTQRRAKRAA